MNKFEFKHSQTTLGADQGWCVQIYNGNRRLLCVLDPSHAWLFLVGSIFGLLLSVVWINAVRHSPPLESSPPAESSLLQVD